MSTVIEKNESTLCALNQTKLIGQLLIQPSSCTRRVLGTGGVAVTPIHGAYGPGGVRLH